MCVVILKILSNKDLEDQKNTNGRRQADGSRADEVDPKPLDGKDVEKWVWKAGE
jgi:hypothetical protein